MIQQAGEQARGRGIGYIKAGRFEDDAGPLTDAAMEAVKDTYGLIINLRDGSGGNISAIRWAVFFPRPADGGDFSEPSLRL